MNATTKMNNLVVFTDFGDDPDDGAAACDYLNDPRDELHIVITSGDTLARAMVFFDMFKEWFDCGDLKWTSNNTFTNKHGTVIKVYVGECTKREMNVDVPLFLWCRDIVQNMVHKASELYRKGEFDMAVFAPLVGVELETMFGSFPGRAVVVGSNPKSELPKSVNTGAGLVGDTLEQSNRNFAWLHQCDVLYLTSGFTRNNAPKFDATVIDTYPKKLQEQCWSVIAKFLVGPRPYKLPPGVQKRVAAANWKTLSEIRQVYWAADVDQTWHYQEAEKYCKLYIGDSMSDEDVSNTANISWAIEQLTGYKLEANLTQPIPQRGVEQFVNMMKNNSEIKGTPNYDGFGYEILGWGWDHLNIDEYNQVN